MSDNVRDILFAAAGIKWSEVFNIPSTSDRNSALIDGTGQVYYVMGDITMPVLVELSELADVTLIPLPEDIVKKVKADPELGSILNAVTIPAGSYKGVDKDVLTVGSFGWLVADKSVSDDVIYEITKLYWEHKDEATTIYSGNKSTLAANLVPTFMPYHPGALKYYKEKGMMK